MLCLLVSFRVRRTFLCRSFLQPRHRAAVSNLTPFWYTLAMDENTPGRTPLIEGVWPPAPLRDEPPPLFLRSEGMQLTRSGDRLIVVNLLIRRSFLAQVCIVSTYSLSPFISFLRNPFHRATLLPYVLSSYRSHYELYLFALCVLAVAWSVSYYAMKSPPQQAAGYLKDCGIRLCR